MRKVLAGHARRSFGRGSYRSVQPVRVAGVAIVNLLRVLLVLEVVAVVEVALLQTLRHAGASKHIIQHAAMANNTANRLVTPPLLRTIGIVA